MRGHLVGMRILLSQSLSDNLENIILSNRRSYFFFVGAVRSLYSLPVFHCFF